jgi:aminoglycoside phosphotransferase (APT) family kinase protein
MKNSTTIIYTPTRASPCSPHPTQGTPAAELEITLDLVQRLLAEQHPNLAYLPLTLIDTGWDNVMYRLGEHLAVRLPRRQLGANLIEREQT